MATTFVFVHGAFGSPAELAPTAPFLAARGHPVINVDLPAERADATLEDYANAVCQAMEGTTGRRIVVAHSAGGGTIPLVAAKVPVDRLVFVAAVVPQPGQSLFDAAGPATQEVIMSVSLDNGDGTRGFNFDLLASLVPEERRAAYLAFLHATQRNQGMRALKQPWSGQSIPAVPRSYILCTQDQIILPERQRFFARSLGVGPIEIDSEHSVFTAKPKELADILHALAE